jgi:hypothetical protein
LKELRLKEEEEIRIQNEQKAKKAEEKKQRKEQKRLNKEKERLSMHLFLYAVTRLNIIDPTAKKQQKPESQPAKPVVKEEPRPVQTQPVQPKPVCC